jgi:tetratricopeptide (TPR) repeat protein
MRRAFALPVLLALAVITSSCAHPGFFPWKARSVPAKPVQTVKKEPISKPEIKPEPPKPEAFLKGAKEEALKGDYDAALASYKSALAKAPAESKNPYLEIFEWIKEGGDRAYEKKDFAEAGYAYSLISSNYPDGDGLSFGKGFLKERVAACSKALTEEGLAEYRKGNLDTAVLKWKSVLKFDPENEEAKKASETAKIQLKNLKKM